MKKFIIFFAALAAVLSCSKENPSNYNPVDGTYSVTLTASAPGADTKTTLVDGGVDDEGKPIRFVHWSKGDAIKVLFFPNTTSLNASYSGSNGVFSSHFDEEISSTAFFRCDSWSWGSTVTEQGISKSLNPEGIALYPANATATSSKPKDKYVNANTELYFVLPSTQNAIKDNIESNLNFSYATIKLSEFENTISNGARTDLTFNNACAMIELTMPSILDKKVTSISIASNSGVSLTGKGNVKLTSYNNVVASPFGVDVTDGNGVTLDNPGGFEPGAKYYIVVWPGEHKSGLTIDFTAEDGTKATKTTPGVTLTASMVKPYTFNKGLDFIATVQDFNYIYADGTTGNDVKSNIVGVVIYRGNPKEKFNDPDLPDQYCNGLAISTKNVSTYWGGTSALSNVPASVKMSSYSTAHANGGYTVKKIWNNNGFNSLPMYDNSSKVDISKYNTSGWYLPVNNEWNYILSNLSDINALLTAAGADTINVSSARSSAYWLPLAYSSNAITIYTDYYGTKAAYYYDWQYNTNRNVRSIFAF